jgi:hypothetical protein
MFEKDIEKYLRESIKQAGGECLKWVSPGTAGVPDRIVICPDGRIAFVELKRPFEKPRPVQRVVLRRLYHLGCRVVVMDNRKSVEGFIRWIVKNGLRS